MGQRSSVSRTVDVDAAPERVWGLVSDLPRMGELSPENTGGSWRRGATGPALGVRFRGSNRQGWRRWSTVVRVVECEPGRRFAFEVDSLGLAVSRWAYEIAERPGGCTVTESWQDRRGRAMELIGLAVSGVADRTEYTARSIDATLAAVKRQVEQDVGTSGH
jgi:hypothetical protein